MFGKVAYTKKWSCEINDEHEKNCIMSITFLHNKKKKRPTNQTRPLLLITFFFSSTNLAFHVSFCSIVIVEALIICLVPTTSSSFQINISHAALFCIKLTTNMTNSIEI